MLVARPPQCLPGHVLHELPSLAAFQGPRASQACSNRSGSSCSRATLVKAEGHASPGAAAHGKRYDVVHLGNLCVDIPVHLPEVPPAEVVKTPAYLESLTASPPARHVWEVGGSSNFCISAARLGLKTAIIGNLGTDSYGTFLRDILQEEGLAHLEPLTLETPQGPAELARTLLCFVLLDPAGRHAFCSRYDFGPWPLLPGVHGLSASALQVIADSAAVFINGFLLDELPTGVVAAAFAHARAAGTATLFDPGPRARLLAAAPDRRPGFLDILDRTDVLLMTQDEAEAITGERDPEAAAAALMAREGACARWVVVKLGARGALVVARGDRGPALHQPALPVDVCDTVGCGDSFGAAVVLGLIQRHALPQTLLLANAVGAATAMGRGAGRSVATAERVAALLARGGGGAGAVPAAGAGAGTAAGIGDTLRRGLAEGDSWQGAAGGNGAAAGRRAAAAEEALQMLRASLARGRRPPLPGLAKGVLEKQGLPV